MVALCAYVIRCSDGAAIHASNWEEWVEWEAVQAADWLRNTQQHQLLLHCRDLTMDL